MKNICVYKCFQTRAVLPINRPESEICSEVAQTLWTDFLREFPEARGALTPEQLSSVLDYFSRCKTHGELSSSGMPFIIGYVQLVDILSLCDDMGVDLWPNLLT